MGLGWLALVMGVLVFLTIALFMWRENITSEHSTTERFKRLKRTGGSVAKVEESLPEEDILEVRDGRHRGKFSLVSMFQCNLSASEIGIYLDEEEMLPVQNISWSSPEQTQTFYIRNYSSFSVGIVVSSSLPSHRGLVSLRGGLLKLTSGEIKPCTLEFNVLEKMDKDYDWGFKTTFDVIPLQSQGEDTL